MVQKEEIRVFQGKKAAKLNKLVLMALFENGSLSPFKIAKKVAALDVERAKKDLYHEAQKINSVLSRRNGRLSDLANKEFIEKTEDGFSLTFNKGFCTALLCYKQIPKPSFPEQNKTLKVFPELKQIIELTRKYYPETEIEDLEEIKTISQNLLKKGLNFEVISNNEFNEYFMREQENLYLHKIKNRKYDNKRSTWTSNPEIKELVIQYLTRLMKISQKQLEEATLAIEKFKADFQSNDKTSNGAGGNNACLNKITLPHGKKGKFHVENTTTKQKLRLP